ncbi:von Willebrand factor type A domain-containing protein [Ureibacillus xyleni]|uniref:von Willebrand factor type A domain-containing protein n=1 Tax=Ureibacillus xyleni TaxID=614648 RepID=A0A285TVA9_9BACL|nr:BatA and WFA domain-containing protein [Ureibacillus xyleni]SOC25656.1 von Willebrand factor type A domain-containing protein [Ureibacillus xyleni]
MGFSNVLFLWASILPLIVLLYYFFRKKYKDQPISSTIFWEEVMQETKASPYLKHLQKNALLYLQLLALILFVLALMNPFIKTSEIAGEQSIWIVDTSATMLAGETFDHHKEEMKSLASELTGQPLTIITTGDEPKTIVRQESDVSAIHKAIDSLEVTFEEEQLIKAIDVAQAYIGETATSIYLFTDSIERGELPISSEHIKWIVKGSSKDLQNVSIKRFAATSIGEEALALIQLKNEADEEKRVELTLQDSQGNVLVEEGVTLKGEEEMTKTFEKLPISQSLFATIQVEDDYVVDNSMVTIIGSGLSQIVVDQQMHQLVQKGFQALNADVKLVPSDQLAAIKEAMIVTNQSELLGKTKSPLVLIGRDDELSEEVNSLVDVSEDALFAFSNLEDVYVNAIYPGFDGFETIATIGEKPFIQRSSKGDIVILADIQSTDWPLHPSFPLFLWSLQSEMLEGSTSLGTFSPNESRGVSLAARDWSIYSKDDEYISSFEDASHFKAPTKPGLYTARSNEDEKLLIVQLSDNEREIKEGTSFELGTLQSNGEEESSKKSIIIWLLIPILLLLVIEWEVQRRRGFTN